MGNLIRILQNKQLAIDSDLINATGSKLRQYYCSYQSICENFVISVPQYIEIFGYDVKSFQIWDTNKQGFINAFEIFTGLILLSGLNFQEKLRFLYEFYDLNQQGSLDYDTIVFMFETACYATIKLYGLPEQIFNEKELIQFLDEYFSEETNMKCQQFYAWCIKINYIPEYFRNIGKQFIIKEKYHQIQKYNPEDLDVKSNKVFLTRKKYEPKLDQRFFNMLKNNKIIQDTVQRHRQFNPQLSWVYGITTSTLGKPLIYYVQKDCKSSNQRLIYVVGKNIVILFPKLSKQLMYQRHEQPISVFQISNNKKMIASGEFGTNPCIRIWDIETLETIQILSNLHRSSIKQIKFMRNDNYILITAQRPHTPLILLNRITKQRILSTYCDKQVLNVLRPAAKLLNKQSVNRVQQQHMVKQRQKFYLILENEIAICEQTNQQYEITYRKAETIENEIKIRKSLICVFGNQQIILILAQNNKIYSWSQNSNFLTELPIESSSQSQSSSQSIKTNKNNSLIVDIVNSSKNRQFYLLFSHTIKIYTLKQISQTFQITTNHPKSHSFMFVYQLSIQIPINLFNGSIIQLILIDNQNLLVMSQMGDIIKISDFNIKSNAPKLQQKTSICQQVQILNNQNRVTKKDDHKIVEPSFKKYYEIFSIGNITGISFITTNQGQPDILNIYENSSLDKIRENILISSGNILYQIDQKERELVKLIVFEQKIQLMDTYQSICAIVTTNRQIIITKYGKIVQKAKKVDMTLKMNKKLSEADYSSFRINTLKINKDYLIIATDQFLFIYSKNGGQYLNSEPKRVKLEAGTPISISSTTSSKIFLVMTKQKLILKLDLQSKDKSMIYSAKQINCQSLYTLYPDTLSIKLALLFNQAQSIYMISQPNGDIYFWNSLNHILIESESYSVMSGHSSSITGLLFKDKGSKIYSAGSTDGTIIQWTNKQTIREEQINNNQGDLSIQKNKNNNKYENVRKFTGIQRLYKEQITYLKQKLICQNMLKDSAVDILIKNQDDFKNLSHIINKILIPDNKQYFAPLVNLNNFNSSQHIKTIKNTIQQRMVINLQLVHVYGFNSQQVRQSIYYGHHYFQQKQNEINKQKIQQTKTKNSNYSYAKDKLKSIDKAHSTCKRYFAYFAGRICIITCPYSKQQKFYNNHKNKITCLSIHPNKNTFCSAQLSSQNAQIHLWNYDSLCPLEVISTKHFKFISKIKFSRKGDLLLSLGGFAQSHSLQIHNTKTHESIAFRKVQNMEIYDIQWNPFDAMQFAICGNNILNIYNVSNKSLQIKQKCLTNSKLEDITCMVYSSNMYGNKIESDIILGNNFGDLNLYICGKYIKCKKNAHSSIINCLKIAQFFKYKTVLISAGQDNYIKLWDTKFHQIGRISTAEIGNGLVAPQSLDIFCCQQTKNRNSYNNQDSQLKNQQGLILVGTRNGSIIEIKISQEYSGLLQHQEEQNQQIQYPDRQQHNTSSKQNINLKIYPQYVGLPSSCVDQINFDIKANFMVTYFYKQSLITLWNINLNQKIKSIQLSGFPSIVKFGMADYLAIGYFDGRIQFYQIQSDFNIILRQQKIVLQSQHYASKLIFSELDQEMAVVCTYREYSSDTFQNQSIFDDYDTNNEHRHKQKIIIYQNFLVNSKFTSDQNNLSIIHNENNKIKKIIIQNQTQFNYVYWLNFGSKKTHKNINPNKCKDLIICYTKQDYSKINNKNKSFIDSEHSYTQNYKLVLYDIIRQQQKQFRDQDFDTINFAPAIQARIKFYPDLLISNSQIKGRFNQDPCKIQQCQNHEEVDLVKRNLLEDKTNIRKCSPFCQMAQIEQFTILGTFEGQIFIVKSQKFYNESVQLNNQLIRAKKFTCFDSPITKICAVDKNLYVSAKQSSNIMKLSLEIVRNQSTHQIKQKNLSKQVQMPKQPQNVSAELTSKAQLDVIHQKIKEIFPRRKNFYQYKMNSKQFRQKFDSQNIQQTSKQNSNNFIELDVKHILGRKAYETNNNLFIDLKQNIISYSGCNLCLNYYDSVTQKYRQNFIKPDSSIFSSNPQISTVVLAQDKRTLYIGTSQQNSQLIIWDISTRTDLSHIKFNNFINISLIRLSNSQKHGCLLATSLEGNTILFFILIQKQQVLACFQLQQQKQKVNDICFYNQEEYRFIACGHNYIAEWSYQNQILQQRLYDIQSYQENFQDTWKIDQVKIFYSVIFISDVAIISSSDGFIYLWVNRRLIKKQNAHPKSAILSLFVAKNSRVFVSGGADGKAIIWQLGTNSMVQKIFQFTIYDGKDSFLSSKYQIQSVCIGNSDIILGTRSGDIYKFNWNLSMEQNSLQAKQLKTNNHMMVLSAFDDDQVNSCSFNISSKKLFILTKSGVISVFNLETYEKISEEKMNIGNNKIVRMLASKLSNKILIVLKKGIQIYQYEQNDKPGTKKPNRFKKANQFLKYTSSEIKAAVLSLNQKYMALLIAPNHLQNSKIEIYDLSTPDDKSFYSLYKVLENIPQNIQIIDFSTDNGFLLYKNPQEDQTIIDLATKQIINPDEVQFQLQWNEQAKKTNGYIRNICSVYSDDNKLQNAIQIMNHSVLATDQMGSIRLFKQTNQQNSLGYYQIYLQHLNDVFMAILSSDCKILVTVGRQDHSIIFWEIKNYELFE